MFIYLIIHMRTTDIFTTTLALLRIVCPVLDQTYRYAVQHISYEYVQMQG